MQTSFTEINTMGKKVSAIGHKMSSLQNKMVSIVIPCYNEEAAIRDVINKIRKINLPLYEIIVVDDGSTDKSAKIAGSFNHFIRLIHHNTNMGYGKTLIDGLQHAKGDLVVTFDADDQHSPHDIPKLCNLALETDADIIVGSRYIGLYSYRIPFVNRIGESFIELMLNLIYGKSIRNNQSGMRVFNHGTHKIIENFKFFGMAFTTEILMKALNQNLTIIEGPIRLKNRYFGISKVKKFLLLITLLRCLFLYFLKKFHK